jgi:phage terminase large subunit
VRLSEKKNGSNKLSDQELLKLLRMYQDNPRRYITEVDGLEQSWKLQDDLMAACPRAIKERKSIYVASGHSLGKDKIAAGIARWFLHTYIPSIVVLTAPTDRQVNLTMYKEIKSYEATKKQDWGGQLYDKPLIKVSDDHYLVGFTTKETGHTKEGGGGKFQGIHSRNICVIVTEAQSVEDYIFDQIDAITTGANVLVIYLGNPTRAKGRFAAGLRNKVDNIVFHFSCLDNPNYLDRRIVIPGLATYEWVEDKRRKWGEDDPRWVGRVLGQVPDNAINLLFPESLINHMKTRRGMLSPYSTDAGVAVDPAGEGVDDNVIMSAKGGEVIETFRRTLMTPSENAIKAVKMCKAINGHFIIFDCDGMGIRDYQEAESLGDDVLQGIQLVKFHGSAPSAIDEGTATGSDERRRRVYGNMRAEAAFVTQQRGKDGLCSIDYTDEELIEDLMADESFEKRGVLYVTPKDEIKETLGRSPGKGDAYKMLQWAFHQKFEDHAVKPGRGWRQYGDMNHDVMAGYRDPAPGALPAYGRMD